MDEVKPQPALRRRTEHSAWLVVFLVRTGQRSCGSRCERRIHSENAGVAMGSSSSSCCGFGSLSSSLSELYSSLSGLSSSPSELSSSGITASGITVPCALKIFITSS